MRLTSWMTGIYLAMASCMTNASDLQLPVLGATASGDDGNPPMNTIDGSLSTRWSAKGDGQWVLYDLGESRVIQSVAIAWYKGDARQARFDVHTSEDAAHWLTVGSGPSSGLTQGAEVYDLADSVGRYVCVVGHGNTFDTWNSITEARVFGATLEAPSSSPEVPWTPLAVTTSGDDGNVGANTVDGSLTTRWSSYGDGQWIRYDLGSVRSTTSMDIAWYRGDERQATFEVQGSVDGTVWVPVFTGLSSGGTLEPEPVDTTDGSFRFVRVVGHGNTVNAWNSITEVRLYGVDEDQGTDSDSGTTGPRPSQVLNLTNWKLTLPVDTALPGRPDEIVQPALAGFEASPYFKATEDGTGVVFRAHCGGVTTSGSGYPRSELREMKAGGADQASWSTTSGTHTMEIVQAITHLPAVKPHVVAGQIHDSKDDVVVFRLEGRKLFVDLNGKTGPVLTSTYELGTVFKVKFVARGGRIECYYNNQRVYTYTKSSTGCYFKAGCYTQSNVSKGDSPDAYGEVVIYGLNVTHQ